MSPDRSTVIPDLLVEVAARRIDIGTATQFDPRPSCQSRARSDCSATASDGHHGLLVEAAAPRTGKGNPTRRLHARLVGGATALGVSLP
jgi:hypothetical protein